MKKLLTLIAGGLFLAFPAFAADTHTHTDKATYQYNNHCALGVAMGKTVTCAPHTEDTTWTDPTSKREYCFSTPEMKTKFAADITGNLAKAETNWTSMQASAKTGHTAMH